jgi:anti-sigma factor RsiW
MAHLGADVAAFVDGQLSEPAMREASDHLEVCDACDRAVRQQRLLKSRMSTVATPEPPATLLASLAGLAAEPPAQERWWVRLGRALPLRAGVVLVSASLAVVATAYVVGGPRDRIGDEAAPPYDRYVADFHGPTTAPADNLITEATMVELDSSGWPCHQTLGDDLHRVSAEFTGDDDVIALSYSDGRSRLNLFEQTGVLDRSGLDGFEPERMADAQVWVRDGSPMIVTWDDDGTVFTIVSDAGRERVAQAVADLPSGSHERDARDRVGDGLSRMSSWINAA